jgi:outer membrane murein-binding lipoprotein Lpp
MKPTIVRLQLGAQADDTRVEVFDSWYDACSSLVISAGGLKETRSERLAQWSSRLSASVSKLKNELRQTRMEIFEAQEGTKTALAQVQDVQESLIQEMQVCLERRFLA